ncbi:MAG: hypothetical protein Q9198_008584 [Flavoplaca austrocitrina]
MHSTVRPKETLAATEESINNLTSRVMPANFLSLPREIRDQIYELVVTQQESIDPWTVHHAPGLLRANKIVHSEATRMFYALNYFDFTTGIADIIISFFGLIGHNYADQIGHIIIAFPDFISLHSHDITLGRLSVSILANIQSNYPKLSTPTTSRNSTNATDSTLNERAR